MTTTIRTPNATIEVAEADHPTTEQNAAAIRDHIAGHAYPEWYATLLAGAVGMVAPDPEVPATDEEICLAIEAADMAYVAQPVPPGFELPEDDGPIEFAWKDMGGYGSDGVRKWHNTITQEWRYQKSMPGMRATAERQQATAPVPQQAPQAAPAARPAPPQQPSAPQPQKPASQQQAAAKTAPQATPPQPGKPQKMEMPNATITIEPAVKQPSPVAQPKATPSQQPQSTSKDAIPDPSKNTKAPWSQTAEEFAKNGGRFFTTGQGNNPQGSLYAYANGQSIRDKTPHQGHDPKDVGLKRPSELTYFLHPDDATKIGWWQGSSAEGKKIIVRGDEILLTSLNAKTGQRGLDGRMKYDHHPEIGKSPLELWGQSRSVAGGWNGNHPGSPITGFVDNATGHKRIVEAAKKAGKQTLSLDSDDAINLGHDVENHKLQQIYNKASQAAQRLSTSAKRDLEKAFASTHPGERLSRVKEFLIVYRNQLTNLLGTTQLAAILEGMRQVVADMPPIPPVGGPAPPPSLAPEDARDLVEQLATLPPMVRAQRIYELPPGQQAYVRAAVSSGAKWTIPEMPTAHAGSVHFPKLEEAVKELAGKNVLPARDYYRLDDAARQKAFTVARVAESETLEKIRDALAEQVSVGADVPEARARLIEAVGEGTFLSRGHLDTVIRNGIQGAFSDGQLNLVKRYPGVRRGFPFAEVLPIDDDRVRPNHLAMKKLGLNGTAIFRVDDPVFQTFKGPWEWSCRCGWKLMSIRRAAERGVEHAKVWLASGVEPPPEFVPWPPFRPDPTFRRSGVPLSIQLSMEPIELGVDVGSQLGATMEPKDMDVMMSAEVESPTPPPSGTLTTDQVITNPDGSIRLRERPQIKDSAWQEWHLLGGSAATKTCAKCGNPIDQCRCTSTMGRYKIVTVNAADLRGKSPQAEEFGDFGTRAQFDFIPANEVWVADTAGRADRRYWIDAGIAQLQAIEGGASSEEAYEVGLRKEKAEREKSANLPKKTESQMRTETTIPEGLRIKLYKVLPGS